MKKKEPRNYSHCKSAISFRDGFSTKNGQSKPFPPKKTGKICLFGVQAANSKNYSKFPCIIIIATSAANRVDNRATEHAQFFQFRVCYHPAVLNAQNVFLKFQIWFLYFQLSTKVSKPQKFWTTLKSPASCYYYYCS